MIITKIILTVATILYIFQSSGAFAESIVIKISGGNLPYFDIFPGSYGILRVCLQSEICLASFIYLKHRVVRVRFFLLSLFCLNVSKCFIYEHKYIRCILMYLLCMYKYTTK